MGDSGSDSESASKKSAMEISQNSKENSAAELNSSQPSRNSSAESKTSSEPGKGGADSASVTQTNSRASSAKSAAGSEQEKGGMESKSASEQNSRIGSDKSTAGSEPNSRVSSAKSEGDSRASSAKSVAGSEAGDRSESKSGGDSASRGSSAKSTPSSRSEKSGARSGSGSASRVSSGKSVASTQTEKSGSVSKSGSGSISRGNSANSSASVQTEKSGSIPESESKPQSREASSKSGHSSSRASVPKSGSETSTRKSSAKSAASSGSRKSSAKSTVSSGAGDNPSVTNSRKSSSSRTQPSRSGSKSKSYSRSGSGASRSSTKSPEDSASRKSSAKSSTSSKALGDYDEYYVVVGKQSGTGSNAESRGSRPSSTQPTTETTAETTTETTTDQQSTSKDSTDKSAASDKKKQPKEKPAGKKEKPDAQPKPKSASGKKTKDNKLQSSEAETSSDSTAHRKPKVDFRRQDLDDEQMKMFTGLYEVLDYENSGSVKVDGVCTAITAMDVGVTCAEIRAVFKAMGKKGKEKITFDEYLCAMAETNKLMESGEYREGQCRKRRQSNFYRAIHSLVKKEQPFDIARRYEKDRKKAPHVLDCYTAGAKLYGLTDRQLAKEMARLKETLKGSRVDSPYAQVLPFVCMDLKEEHSKRKKAQAEFKLAMAKTGKPPSTPTPTPDRPSTTAAAASCPTSVTSAGAATPIRKTAKLQQMNYKFEPGRQQKIIDRSGKSPRQIRRVPGWSLPNVERHKAPLPILPDFARGRDLTIEDVKHIREKVGEIMEGYYGKLRKRHVAVSKRHWEALYPQCISSPRLRTLFAEAYESYFPMYEEDVFAKCPWVPMNILLSPARRETFGMEDPYSKRFMARFDRNRERYGPLPRIPQPGIIV